MDQWLLPALLSGRKLSPGSCHDVRHVSSSLYSSAAFQADAPCWSSEGVSLSKPICGPFKRNCLEIQQFKSSTASILT